jgi:transcriptional regulator with XRE-family HTH domain
MRIREILKEQGITTKELAEKMGISQSALNQNISGNPSVRILSNIANTLNVPIWQLFADPAEIQAKDNSFITCPHCGREIQIEIKPGS